MVMAQSLFLTLHARHPGIAIDVLAPGWSRPVLARMPQVRRAVELDVAHGELAWGRRRRMGLALRDAGYDQAIVLPRSLKAALAPFHARIRRRTGYRGESRYWLINDMRPLDRQALPRMVQRLVALGLEPGEALPEPLPTPSLTCDPTRVAALRAAHGLDPARPAAAIMAGARYGPAKCWPLERYAELAGRLRDAGFQVWLLGSAADRQDAERIDAAAGGGTLNLCGRTGLDDAIDLLSAAAVAVGNDSGLLHVAAAVGTPVVALYGSSTPAYTPPLTEKRRVIYRGLACSPCFQRHCPLGHYRCLTEITVDEVYTAAASVAGATS